MNDLRGVFAAAVTPLLDGERDSTRPASGDVADFLVKGGVDGALVCGTAGEGMVAERRRAQAGARRLPRGRGARDSRSWRTAARRRPPTPRRSPRTRRRPARSACRSSLRPTSRSTSGRCSSTSPPPRSPARRCRSTSTRSRRAAAIRCRCPVIERLGERVPNLAGLKVSEAPWERFEPYLIDGLDIFVGPEALIDRGLAGGAIGAISALASALPELVVAAVRERTPEATERAAAPHADARAVPDAGGLEDRLRVSRRPHRERRCAHRCARSTPTSDASSRASCAGCSRPSRRERPRRQGDRCRGPARQRRAAARHPRGRAQPAHRRRGAQARHAARRAALRRGRDVRGLRRGARAASTSSGLHANTTLLGEDVLSADEARAVVAEYVQDPRRHRRARPARQRRAQAHAPRPAARRGARLRERQATRRPRRRPRQLHPPRHGALGPRRPDARHLPAPARRRPRRRRHRAAGLPLPHARRPRARCCRCSRTCASSRARTSSRPRSPTRARPTSTPRTRA